MPYHSYQELVNLFTDLESNHPDVVGHEVVGQSVEGEDIYLFKVGRGDAKTLFVGSMHGNERPGGELLYLYAEWLVNKEEGVAEEILNNNLTLIVPVANPDGHPTTRKNPNGVDCNRNFPHEWCGCGSSTNPSSPVYKGPSANSEPETNAIHKVYQEYGPAWFLSIHTGTEVLAYPWSYTNDRPPDNSYYQEVGSKITELSNSRGVQPYNYGQVPYTPTPVDIAGRKRIGKQVVYCCSGVSIDDSYNMGIYSMVLEATRPYNPPYNEVECTYFNRFLPIAITLSEESREVTPIPMGGIALGVLAVSLLAGYTYNEGWW